MEIDELTEIVTCRSCKLHRAHGEAQRFTEFFFKYL